MVHSGNVSFQAEEALLSTGLSTLRQAASNATKYSIQKTKLAEMKADVEKSALNDVTSSSSPARMTARQRW